jgi:hypothetical protein
MRGLADNASQRNVGWIERAKSMPERISDRYQRLSKRSKVSESGPAACQSFNALVRESGFADASQTILWSVSTCAQCPWNISQIDCA